MSGASTTKPEFMEALGKVAALETEVSGLKNDLTGVKNDVTSLAGKVDAGFARLFDRIEHGQEANVKRHEAMQAAFAHELKHATKREIPWGAVMIATTIGLAIIALANAYISKGVDSARAEAAVAYDRAKENADDIDVMRADLTKHLLEYAESKGRFEERSIVSKEDRANIRADFDRLRSELYKLEPLREKTP